jgi:hypothetical protein
MTKREKEQLSLRHRIKRLEKLRDQAIRDLVMTENRLPALRKRHKQLTDRLLAKETNEIGLGYAITSKAITSKSIREELFHGLAAVGDKTEAEVPAPAPVASQKDDGLDIPKELDRSRQLQTLPDPRTKEKKAERRAVEREVRDRELTGKRRKMPLTGKAALDAVRDSR